MRMSRSAEAARNLPVGEKASEQAAGVIPHTFLKHAQSNPPAAALRKAFAEANASMPLDVELEFSGGAGI